MEKEQTMLTMLVLMLGIITVFIIFVVFYMIISHKRKDIGILKSVGVTAPAVMQIFTVYAILIGLVGAVIGAAAACGFLVKLNNIEDWIFNRFGWELFNKEVYAIGYLPNTIEWKVLTVVVFSAILASLIGAFLPSMYAVRRRPVEILQVDQL
jgi:lipoprotein-releasing system permease protein